MAEKDQLDGKAGNKNVIVHHLMSDAGQFSFAAVCALCLKKLFSEKWHNNFNRSALSMILDGLKQSKQVRGSIEAIYEGKGQDDIKPFTAVVLAEECLQPDASPVIKELITIAVVQGKYDAHVRVLFKVVAWRLHVSLDCMEEMECELAETIFAQHYQMSDEEKAKKEKKARRRKYKQAALIGLATVTGGTLIGLTGGLALPLVAAGAGMFIVGSRAAALGSVAGVAINGSLFGDAGAGLTGYKMYKIVGEIEEFQFEPLVLGGPLHAHTIRQQLHITITVTGWLDKQTQDFRSPWRNLAESSEQYVLCWESKHLMELGTALDYVWNTAISMATKEALKYTVLSAPLAVIAWPATLLSVSNDIDNPWFVALTRAVATGRQLAEVLLRREPGKRPVTLIGYSLGGRVIFYCLEEMAKCKGSEGIVEEVFILGAPVTSDPKSWAQFERVVAGRIINGYCRGDWMLKFLYRSASVQLRIAGLAPISWKNRRMHNIDLTDVVSGHMDYGNQLDTILEIVGVRLRNRSQRKSPSKSSTFSSSERLHSADSTNSPELSSSFLSVSSLTFPVCGQMFEKSSPGTSLQVIEDYKDTAACSDTSDTSSGQMFGKSSPGTSLQVIEDHFKDTAACSDTSDASFKQMFGKSSPGTSLQVIEDHFKGTAACSNISDASFFTCVSYSSLAEKSSAEATEIETNASVDGDVLGQSLSGQCLSFRAQDQCKSYQPAVAASDKQCGQYCDLLV